MEAVRCIECGETRWSLLPARWHILWTVHASCAEAEVVIERRRPGAGPEQLDVERRRAAIADRIAAIGSGSRLRPATR